MKNKMDIEYFKVENYLGAVSYIAFDWTNLKSIDLFRGKSVEIHHYDHEDEVNFGIQLLYENKDNKVDRISREVFNEQVKLFSKNYNDIIKEL
jgi:hypothetical protein